MKQTVTITLLMMLGCTNEPPKDPATNEDLAETSEQTNADTSLTAPHVDTDVPPSDEITVTIVPITDVIEEFDPVVLVGQVNDTRYAPSQLTVTWSSDLDGVIAWATAQPDGTVELDSLLSPGWHNITLQAINPMGEYAYDTVPVAVCSWGQPADFSTDINGAGWAIFNDAYWDPGGWLEMTGNVQSKTGQICLVEEKITPGDLDIEFTIFTGGGINSGADGFAVSIFNVPTWAEMEEIIANASNGGCLAYGVSNGCGDLVVDAFHVEFDTWYNGDWWIDDPTPDNHVAINLDGSAQGHPLWAPIPTIEDQVWHDITVSTVDDLVLVTIDGTDVIKGEIAGLDFEGGYLCFSGTTGWATNWHRFDNLRIIDQCEVPDTK